MGDNRTFDKALNEYVDHEHSNLATRKELSDLEAFAAGGIREIKKDCENYVKKEGLEETNALILEMLKGIANLNKLIKEGYMQDRVADVGTFDDLEKSQILDFGEIE